MIEALKTDLTILLSSFSNSDLEGYFKNNNVIKSIYYKANNTNYSIFEIFDALNEVNKVINRDNLKEEMNYYIDQLVDDIVTTINLKKIDLITINNFLLVKFKNKTNLPTIENPITINDKNLNLIKTQIRNLPVFQILMLYSELN